MAYNNGQTVTLNGPDGHEIRVRLEVNSKARRLILRLDERKREAVAIAPSRRQIKDAAAFAAERIDWISKRLQHLPDVVSFEEGSVISFRGMPCRLTSQGEGRVARMVLGQPNTLCAPGDPETLHLRTTRYLKKQARADITRAVKRHSARLGVTYEDISVKDTRSRWGSCTADGKLSFSWRLVMAPPAVLDYVAAHECAHLLEMNHSPRFWAHVATCCSDWKHHRTWLREHGASLQAAGT
ncbi:MAG: SprT family zinc-dependent metalloprotease [Pseudomonadota bacterium]|nr:SprT family zinc-dependent metalloprotease [Pseudomonadota bacterium]